MLYIFMPIIAWIIAGSMKFLLNYIRFGNQARSMIGYGGFPSTHTTIMSSVVFLAGFRNGFETSLFSLGLGALLIVVIDAHGLRRKVGEQAHIINNMQDKTILRERIGHSWSEILGGFVLGILIAYGGFIVAGGV